MRNFAFWIYKWMINISVRQNSIGYSFNNCIICFTFLFNFFVAMNKVIIELNVFTFWSLRNVISLSPVNGGWCRGTSLNAFYSLRYHERFFFLKRYCRKNICKFGNFGFLALNDITLLSNIYIPKSTFNA